MFLMNFCKIQCENSIVQINLKKNSRIYLFNSKNLGEFCGPS